MNPRPDDALPNRRRSWTLLLIVLLAAALRFYRLDNVPPAINQDEAVHAYDAWCLLETGKDHRGEAWPIFFRAFRDYHPGVFVYLLMPLQALFGMNVWTTRLPGALIGVVGVWLLYELLRRVYNDRAAAMAALFLAVSPWHVHVTRLAFEAGTCPTLMVLAMLLLLLAVRRQNSAIWLASGLIFGLTAWTYHAMRVFVPLLLLAIVVVYRDRLRQLLVDRRTRRFPMVWGVGLFIGLLPFLWAWFRNPEAVWTRAASVSVFHKTTGLADGVMAFVRNYLQNLSPDFFFIGGDHSLVQSIAGYGQLHYFCAILIPVGLYRAVRRWRQEPFTQLVIWWILLSPVPAAAANWEGGHALRSIGGLPAYQILAALGGDFILAAVGARSAASVRRFLIAGAAVLALNVGYFLKLFFADYPIAAAQAFQSEWREVFAEVDRRKADYDAFLFTSMKTNQLGILYLYWTRMPPREYFAQSPQYLPGPTFDRLLQIGPVVFARSEELPGMLPLLGHHRRLLVAERPDIPVPGRELRRFPYPDGRVGVILYEVRQEDIPARATTSPASH
ncbi:MAG TPA: glycosyltransferase family 39 protein [Phycisphaerae bacterium]|nr:glycosyltransferase family 39 protein [Phycisphaerae bacterium]